MRILRTDEAYREPPLDVPAGERCSPAPDLERSLFRHSVDQLTADRAHCADCGRTPLIGEDLHLYDGGLIVCELCRQLRREAPVHTATVRHSEFGQSVKVRRVVLPPASPTVRRVLPPASPTVRAHFLEGVPERPSDAA